MLWNLVNTTPLKDLELHIILQFYDYFKLLQIVIPVNPPASVTFNLFTLNLIELVFIHDTIQQYNLFLTWAVHPANAEHFYFIFPIENETPSDKYTNHTHLALVYITHPITATRNRKYCPLWSWCSFSHGSQMLQSILIFLWHDSHFTWIQWIMLLTFSSRDNGKNGSDYGYMYILWCPAQVMLRYADHNSQAECCWLLVVP